MGLVGNNTRRQHESLQNILPRILLFKMVNIWKQPPWSIKTIIISGVILVILVMVYLVSTERMATSIGNKRKARKIFPL